MGHTRARGPRRRRGAGRAGAQGQVRRAEGEDERRPPHLVTRPRRRATVKATAAAAAATRMSGKRSPQALLFGNAQRQCRAGDLWPPGPRAARSGRPPSPAPGRPGRGAAVPVRRLAKRPFAHRVARLVFVVSGARGPVGLGTVS